MSKKQESRASKIKRVLESVWVQPKSRWLLGIPLGGFVMFIFGFIAWFSFEFTLAATNTTEFCTSCHSMGAYIKPEWAKSVHYKNKTGVRAGCSDCHVPKAFVPKMVAKVLAVKDVYHEIIGTIDTPEKFENYRLLMAERVWDKMRATNSRECRSCHTIEQMAFDKQLTFQHNPVEEMGLTCIDCHKGIAHTLPKQEVYYDF